MDSLSREITPSSPTSYDVVARVVQANPSIQSLSLVTYHEGPNWHEHPPLGQGDDLPALLRGIRQDAGERILARLSRDEASAGRLREFVAHLGDGRLLGLISRVSLSDGASRHIPMMDFMCPISAANLQALMSLLKEVKQGTGWLLESGRSYHYYGAELLSEETWRIFLGKCLLMFGYVDDRYVGHQLVDGHCVLRLSAGRLRTSVPRLVAEF